MHSMIGLDVLTRQVNVNHGGLDALMPEYVLELPDPTARPYVIGPKSVP